MNQTAAATTDVTGPPAIKAFDHLSLPCRDLDEAIKFYRDVLGAEHVVSEGAFALFKIGGIRIGVSSEGNTFMTPGAEYPHIAFNLAAPEVDQMRAWLEACGIPMTNLWTRNNQVTLMFFRDPSGNMIELFCDGEYPGSENLPSGPVARGHGVAIDVDATRYDEWKLPGE
jgi:catechol 2,3-dioxygenase-like lactoylglutathione lyase family enzyme